MIVEKNARMVLSYYLVVVAIFCVDEHELFVTLKIMFFFFCAKPNQANPSQAEASQANPSQAEASQAKPTRCRRATEQIGFVMNLQ